MEGLQWNNLKNRRRLRSSPAVNNEAFMLELPGAGGTRSVRSLRGVVRSHHPSIMGLIKTKKIKEHWEGLRCSLGFAGCLAVPSRGSSEGISRLWKEGIQVTLSLFLSDHIDVKIEGDHEFRLTIFYGRPKVCEGADSWNLLRRLKEEGEGPWLVMGDFNKILHTCEMEGATTRERWKMKRFSECLAECGLEDLVYGNSFTYSNSRLNEWEVKARLDRFVANWAWKNLFSGAYVWHSIANSSDHIPIVIDLQRMNKSSKRKVDRFEPMWVRHEDFKRVLQLTWEEAGRGSSDYEGKLRNCLKRLLCWNKSIFGRVDQVIKELKEKIKELKRKRRS